MTTHQLLTHITLTGVDDNTNLANSASETIWCSPHCVAETGMTNDLFAEVA